MDYLLPEIFRFLLSRCSYSHKLQESFTIINMQQIVMSLLLTVEVSQVFMAGTNILLLHSSYINATKAFITVLVTSKQMKCGQVKSISNSAVACQTTPYADQLMMAPIQTQQGTGALWQCLAAPSRVNNKNANVEQVVACGHL